MAGVGDAGLRAVVVVALRAWPVGCLRACAGGSGADRVAAGGGILRRGTDQLLEGAVDHTYRRAGDGTDAALDRRARAGRGGGEGGRRVPQRRARAPGYARA